MPQLVWHNSSRRGEIQALRRRGFLHGQPGPRCLCTLHATQLHWTGCSLLLLLVLLLLLPHMLLNSRRSKAAHPRLPPSSLLFSAP